jgi:hypothetical protein
LIKNADFAGPQERNSFLRGSGVWLNAQLIKKERFLLGNMEPREEEGRPIMASGWRKNKN